MLKFASTGSSWVAGLLQGFPCVKFHSELITGRIGSNMSDVEKLIVMEKGLRGCKGKALCGFSINSKKAANLDFTNFAATQNAKLLSELNRSTATLGQIIHPTSHSSHGNLPLVRMVVWVRSSLVVYAVGLWRSDQLRAGPCGVNNQKKGSKKETIDCKLPASNLTFPLDAFVWRLKRAQLLHAINLGIAYRHWNPTGPVSQGPLCVDDGAGGASPRTAAASMLPSNTERIPIYELYYEDMLRDKAGTMKALLTWLGVKNDLPVPEGKVVKFTPATLRGLLQNFDEIRAWLSDHSQCLLTHLLDPEGTRVVPPCPFHFNPEEPEEGEGNLFFKIARRKMEPDPIPTSVTMGTRLLVKRYSVLRLSFLKNQLISSKFALHEKDRVVGLIDLASPAIDLKS